MKIVWNIPGFEEVRRLPKLDHELKSSAEAIAQACGEGYVAAVSDGRTRSRASVVTTTVDAIRDNRRNNTLVKNVDAGRKS